ncbi:MAG: T9SS type A sorting domain-containing protein [Bacteroidia bacterium]|nr:T9SS type A sorting domain-containing protein [Bacteroidia bacterium]
MKKIGLLLLISLAQLGLFAQVTNYYSKSTGAINSLSTWGTNTNGTGTSPSSFTANNCRYYVHNRSLVNLYGLGNFIIGGSNTVLIVGNGLSNVSFYVPEGNILKVDSMYLDSAVSLYITGISDCLKPKFSFYSSVIYQDTNVLQPIMPGSYGKLFLLGGATNNFWPDTRTKILKGDVQARNYINIDCIVYCDTFSLTIGESPTKVGTLAYNTYDKYGRVIGTMKRWIPATTTSGIQGLFPLGSPNKKHQLLYIQNTIAPSTGGLVSVNYLPFFAGNAGLPIIDSSSTPILNLNRLHTGFYDVNVESGLTGGTFTIYANPTAIGNVNWEGALRMLKRDGSNSNWRLDSLSFGGGISAFNPQIGISGMAYLDAQYVIASDSNINTLPVQLINFSGKYSQGKIYLNWATASETNTKEFVVSILDQTNWISLEKIKAFGNSKQTKKYSYQIDYPSEEKELVLQLSCYDKDGSMSFSKQLVLNKDARLLEITLTPKPFQEKLEITYFGLNQNAEAKLLIRDGQGKIVKEEYLNLVQGNKQSKSTSELTPGIYFVEIRIEGQTFKWKQIKI